jgi:hypothetical protein
VKKLVIFLCFGILLNLTAQNIRIAPPPAEMIMMGGFDDDVESVDDIDMIDVGQKSEPSIKNSADSVIDLTQNSSISLEGGAVKVALLAPKKVIGSYADSVCTSIISYLIFRDAEFVFEVFDSVDESESSIIQKLSEIKAKGYNFVIAPYTQKGAEIIVRNSLDLLIFIPTINRFDTSSLNSNIIFGGMDYKRQIDILLSQITEKVVLFGDGSSVSNGISTYITDQIPEKVVYKKDIKNIRANLSSFLKKNKRIQKSSVFLNMPIVKSSLLASQITQNKVQPYVLLSTQFNYNPLLFKLTQYKDREFMYVANSINFQNKKLKDINLVLGNNPDYNWIDYSTTIGMDYIYTNIIGQDRIFGEEIYDNQIEYKVRLERAGRSSFIPYGSGKYQY